MSAKFRFLLQRLKFFPENTHNAVLVGFQAILLELELLHRGFTWQRKEQKHDEFI